MRTDKTIQVVSAHAEGEVGNVIVGGVLPPPGKTVKEQRDWLQSKGDDLRRLLIREPRGGVFTHFNLIVPSKDPEAQAGFIIMEPMDYPPMSGSNSMCVATVLLETGMLRMEEPITTLKLETPGGLVSLRCECEAGKVRRVTTTNVPCYVHERDITVAVEGLGEIKTDICYGGAFFAIVEASSVGIEIECQNARRIVEIGEAIKEAVRERINPIHPILGDIGGVTFVNLIGPITHTDSGPESINASIISPGKIDRSPCGTASSARVALMHSRDQIATSEAIRLRSILGTEFELRIEKTQSIGKYEGVVPTISGCAWITGQHSYYLDPSDPFPTGYSLADTAYQLY